MVLHLLNSCVKFSVKELLDLVELVRARTPGTWENFLNLYDPQFRQLVTSPSGRAKPFLLAFFSTLQTEEYLQVKTHTCLLFI